MVLIINLLFSTSFPTKPPRIVEKTAMLLFYKKLTSSDGYRQIVSCVEQLTFQFDQILVDPGFQMAIADIFLTIETNHRSFASRVYCIDPILHFCHFWALGASLEASFAKSICPAIIAYSSRNYDPGEIIILMVFARTNE